MYTRDVKYITIYLNFLCIAKSARFIIIWIVSRIPPLENQFHSMQKTLLPLNLARLLMNFVGGGGQKWSVASKPSIGSSAAPAAITFPRVQAGLLKR